ncbi:MAG: hypothetical protein JST93_14160 [Acidobacteria bacterium]|nr:hypothetical protein [Acidobacteriota bacterium]
MFFLWRIWRFFELFIFTQRFAWLSSQLAFVDAKRRQGLVERLARLIMSNSVLRQIAAHYGADANTLTQLYIEFVSNGYGELVNNLWLPSALLGYNAPLEFVLFHWKTQRPLPRALIVEYLKNRRNEPFVDREQELRVDGLNLQRQYNSKPSSPAGATASLALYLLILLPTSQAISGTVLDKAVKGILYLLMIQMALVAVVQARCYTQSFRQNLRPFMALMRPLYAGSIGPFSTPRSAIAGACGLALIAVALFLDWNWLHLGLFLVVNSCCNELNRLWPPLILLLSSSSVQATALNRKLAMAIQPMQCTSMIETDVRRLVLDLPSRLRTLRQVPGRPWLSVVEDAMKMSALIVLDSRDVSTGLVEEIAALKRLKFEFKTAVIVASRNHLTETSVRRKLGLTATFLLESEAVDLARLLRTNRTIRLSLAHPVSALAKQSIQPRNPAKI